MRRVISLLLVLVTCVSLCACGSKKMSEDDIRKEVEITIQAKAAVKCLFEYKDVKNVLASVITMDNKGDGTYDAKGYITVIDAYGDRYRAKFDAAVSIDEEGEGTCKSFDMDTPRKE